MLTAESIIFLLINKVDTVYDPEKEIEVKLDSPIERWKQLLGNKDPAEATSEEAIVQQKV